MRVILALLLAALLAPALPAPSRAETGVSTDAATRIRSLLDQATTAMAPRTPQSGRDAFAFINPANDLAIANPDLPLTLTYLPNLMAARAYRLQYDWPNMEIFAGSVLSALDAPEFTTHPMRIEAAARLGQAMVRQSRDGDAAAILAPLIAATKDAAPSAELSLLRFWYGAAATLPAAPGWMQAATDAFDLRDDPQLRSHEVATFLDNFLFQLIEHGADTETILTVADASGTAARKDGVHPEDRAVYTERVADVLGENGKTDAALQIAQAELDHLGSGYGGSRARNGLGMQLIRLWFQTGEIDRGIAFADTLLDETMTSGDINWVDVNLLQMLRGAAYNHLELHAESQEAYRRSYAAIRQYERASSRRAQDIAAVIDRADPGFPGFEYAGELADVGDIRPDGPADAVLLRFLAGEYAINEQVMVRSTWTEETANLAELYRNRALHYAVSGQAAKADEMFAGLRESLAPSDAAARDEITLFAALSAFWWQGDGPRAFPDLFADLPRLAAALPPDRANFARALIVVALNSDGRGTEAQAALQDWRRAADDQTDGRAPRPRTPWDVAAAMVAVEMAYSLYSPDLGRTLAEQGAAWMADQPPMALARDYFALVRLLNAPNDLETDQGLLDLGAIVQRLSAQVPDGHILRASSRFGLAKALWARDRLPQTRDMMAATAEAIRANPGHRPDVLAFVQSVQAQVLSQMGNHDLALNMARAAQDALTPDARPDYRAGIAITLATELVHAGRDADAAQFAARTLGDPALLDALLPDLQIEALRNNATLQDRVGDTDLAATLLDRAVAIADSHAGVTRTQQIGLTWDRAVHAVRKGSLEDAFRLYATANDLSFAERARVAAGSTSGQVASLAQDLDRVLAEVEAGWQLEQSLPPE